MTLQCHVPEVVSQWRKWVRGAGLQAPRKKEAPGTQYMIPDRRGARSAKDPGCHASIMGCCGFQTV